MLFDTVECSLFALLLHLRGHMLATGAHYHSSTSTSRFFVLERCDQCRQETLCSTGQPKLWRPIRKTQNASPTYVKHPRGGFLESRWLQKCTPPHAPNAKQARHAILAYAISFKP